jgi:pimeloyl-ACP methyl ester carboxylesterase
VVLVHCGWADSSGWNAEVTALQQQGYPVIAVAGPLRGLSSDAGYVRSVLQATPGPIVLVGHSYGGAFSVQALTGGQGRILASLLDLARAE